MPSVSLSFWLIQSNSRHVVQQADLISRWSQYSKTRNRPWTKYRCVCHSASASVCALVRCAAQQAAKQLVLTAVPVIVFVPVPVPMPMPVHAGARTSSAQLRHTLQSCAWGWHGPGILWDLLCVWGEAARKPGLCALRLRHSVNRGVIKWGDHHICFQKSTLLCQVREGWLLHTTSAAYLIGWN